MEFIDFLILGVGCIIFFEAARRLDLIERAYKLKEKISDTGEDGIPDNSISFKILTSPEDTKWSPGIGAAINDRPFVLFLLIILVLAFFGVILTFVAQFSNASFLLMVIAFSLAFHSGPDSISKKERYLGIIVTQDSNKLNSHDLNFLIDNIKEYRSWPFVQLVFGLVIITTIFLPSWLKFLVALFILIAGLCYLGSKYSISKGIFSAGPGI